MSRRGKVVGGHILKQTAVEGTALRIGGCMIEISHTDKQFTIAHLKLENESEFMVTLDIVYHLHYWPIVLARIVEHHGVARLDDGEPLPVGVHLRGEAAEDRVLRIAQDAKGTWGNRLLVVF